MNRNVSSYAAIVCAAFLGAETLGCRGPDRLVFTPGATGAGRACGALESGRIKVSRRVTALDGVYSVDLVFSDKNESFAVRFDVGKESFGANDDSWGYREEDIARLKQWHESARQAALRTASDRNASQAQLDAELKDLKAEHDRRFRAYIVSQGFRFLADGTIEADIAALVRRNAPRLAPLARTIERNAGVKSHARDLLLLAATAMVQTSVDYEPVDAVIGGVHTGGIWPPVNALVHGRGDCDTKAALLASILANLPGTRLLGVKITGHYLLGVLMKPSQNDSYIRYQNRKYVLIEPAGPACLPPGALSKETQSLFLEGEPHTVTRLF
ncbi:MAG TPA: hypothetical protein DEB40_12970 [Elusimicrobia bacterium]|nr:hypothetical protein [Elusimicrobiota bacterium]HBT62646.1 hypothetical protein [Elusimicrobiota bacterium]